MEELGLHVNIEMKNASKRHIQITLQVGVEVSVNVVARGDGAITENTNRGGNSIKSAASVARAIPPILETTQEPGARCAQCEGKGTTDFSSVYHIVPTQAYSISSSVRTDMTSNSGF